MRGGLENSIPPRFLYHSRLFHMTDHRSKGGNQTGARNKVVPSQSILPSRMKNHTDPLNWVLQVVLIVTLGGLYLSTLAPGLSWANNGADGGDFISAAATSGVPHPTGYPTYLLLARLFQFIPFGSLAFRTNLLSAISATLAALLVYHLVISLPYHFSRGNHLAGLIAALAYGVSPLVWSQAVITEVYSLNALFVAAVLLLLLPDAGVLPIKPATLDRLSGLLLGLALGNHVTAAAFLPLLLVGTLRKTDTEGSKDAYATRKIALFHSRKVDWKPLITRIVWLGAGLCIYLVLPLRAVSNPSVNWGDPVSINNFFWLISGRLYAGRVFAVSGAMLLVRLKEWVGFLVAQSGWLGLTIGIAGVIFCRPLPLRLYLASGWIFVVFSAFSMGYNSYDSTVLLIPVTLILALWFGLGVSFGMQFISRPAQWLGVASGLLLLLVFAFRIPSILPGVDASKDGRAEAFGLHVMTSVPESALVFTSGDEDTCAIWYFHYALHQRPDMVVMLTGLLPFDWYRASLRTTYPALVIPDDPGLGWKSTIISANPGRTVCITNSLGDAVVNCY